MPTKNPQGGHPVKERDKFYVASLARDCTDDAVKLLKETMNDSTVDRAVRLRAAEELLNRGWGRAAQIVDITSTEDRSLNLTIEVRHFNALDQPIPAPVLEQPKVIDAEPG